MLQLIKRCPEYFTLLRLQSPIIRIHGSQRDISSVADHERPDGDEICDKRLMT